MQCLYKDVVILSSLMTTPKRDNRWRAIADESDDSDEDDITADDIVKFDEILRNVPSFIKLVDSLNMVLENSNAMRQAISSFMQTQDQN